MFLAGFEFFFGVVAALFVLFVVVPIAFKLIFRFFWWLLFGVLGLAGFVSVSLGYNDGKTAAALIMIALMVFMWKESRQLARQKKGPHESDPVI